MRLAFVLAAASLLALSGCSEEQAPIQGAAGRALAEDKGCLNCHTTDGAKSVGPTWKGLADSRVELDDGTQVAADASYLTESILQPSAKTVKGFEAGLMESVIKEGAITKKQAEALVAYIKTLK